MKRRTQPLVQSRAEVVFGYTRRMLHERRLSMETFAARVVELYHARVPAAARSIEFKSDGDLYQVARVNAQRLSRYMQPEICTRMPVEIEEPWVLALDEPYRTDCVRELAARYGLLAVPIPDDAGAVSDAESLGRLTRELGEFFTRIAPVMADGIVDARDCPHLAAAIAEADVLMGAVQGFKARLVAVQKRGGADA
jgi:hypothetical protein